MLLKSLLLTFDLDVFRRTSVRHTDPNVHSGFTSVCVDVSGLYFLGSLTHGWHPYENEPCFLQIKLKTGLTVSTTN